MDRKLLNINGIPTNVMCDSTEKLADVIRHQAGLTGTKVACGQGQCGCCSVILNGKVVRACTTTMKRVPAESEITTIEGIGTPDRLHALQLAWILHGGAQCGYCSPGFIVSSKALLDQNPDPTREEIRDWWQKHANVCRCTGYKPLVDAVIDAAKVLRGEMSEDELVYKVPEDGHIWNTRFPRPSAIPKVTGTLDYGADLELKMPPGTLHCAVVHAQVSHANVLSIDVSEAEKMPGVFKVVTHKDVKGRNRINGLVMYPDDVKADGWERPILCDTKVFQYGDALAIVCADTIEQARAAVPKVKVELEELPAYMNALDAMADDAIEIYPGTPNMFFTQQLIKGEDTEDIFQDGAARGGRQVLPAAPATPVLRARLRLCLHRRRGSPDDPLQERRPQLPRGHDQRGPRRRAREPAHGPEPHRRHVRLQVLPHDGGSARRRPDGDRPHGLPQVRLLDEHRLHRQALAALLPLQARRRRERQVPRHGEPLVVRPRPLHGVRRQPRAEGPALRRRLRHPQHAWLRPSGAHQPLLGLAVPRLGLAAGLLRR